MNAHTKIRPSKAVASYEIETAARVLYHATVMLRATPSYPDNDAIYAGRLAYFDIAVEDMKKALEND